MQTLMVLTALAISQPPFGLTTQAEVTSLQPSSPPDRCLGRDDMPQPGDTLQAISRVMYHGEIADLQSTFSAGDWQFRSTGVYIEGEVNATGGRAEVFVSESRPGSIYFVGEWDVVNGREVTWNCGFNFGVATIEEIPIGDSTRDGRFDSSDLVAVFAAGKYEDGIQDNATWDTGDWDLSGDFDTRDLVFAFQGGAYETTTAAVPVPEPSAAIAFPIGLMVASSLRSRSAKHARRR